MAAIKDFIYLDVDRLTSLYSQVFEGVADTIVQTELNEEEGKNTQKGGMIYSGATVEERVAAASYKTESKLLHDHMYNLLEKRLTKDIIDVTTASQSNYEEKILNTFLIKVRGKGEIWDFKRLRDFMKKYNQIGLALSYITNYNKEQRLLLLNLKDNLTEEIKKIQHQGSKRAETEEKKKRLAEIEALLNPVEVAKGKNLQFDEDFLEHFSLLSESMYADNIEVIIHPSGQVEELLFRGILLREWFRISPEMLRMLHAGYPASEWTMVGQVTYVPSSSQDAYKETIPETPGVDTFSSEATSSSQSQMRDGYRGLVKAYYNVEQTFAKNKKIIEVIIHPLAVYRESTLSEE